MSVLATAPGKLVLTGEYAVLEGAPALVLAVDRRARVTLDQTAANVFVIDAPALDVHDAVAHMDVHRRLLFDDAQLAGKKSLRIAVSVIESLAAGGALPGFRVALDTRSFFSSAREQRKFGLGSSAALAVALGGALRAHAGLDPPSACALTAAHRAAQGGHGSGLDIAASLTGGVIEYRLRNGQPQITPASWPAELLFCCAWSMRAASTEVFLRGLAAWRGGAPARYRALMRELATCGSTAAAALREHNVVALLEAVDAYAAALARLGCASGLDIVSAEHRSLGAVALACGVTYKPCGAGGGDIGIALTTDADRLRAFRQGVVQAGLQCLDLQLELCGLQVD